MHVGFSPKCHIHGLPRHLLLTNLCALPGFPSISQLGGGRCWRTGHGNYWTLLIEKTLCRWHVRPIRWYWNGGVLVPSRWTIMGGEFIYLLKLIDDQQHTQHEFHQAKLKLSTEWIPDCSLSLQGWNWATIPCAGLQMCCSKCGGLQGKGHSRLLQGGVDRVGQVYIHMYVVSREGGVWEHPPPGKNRH